MTLLDISSLNYVELMELRKQTNERLTEMRETGLTQLRATIVEQAGLLGIEPKDLIPKKQRKQRRKKGEASNVE